MSFLHHLVRILALIALSGLLFSCSKPDESTGPVTEAEPKMDSLVSVEWLSQHLGDPGLVVLDSTVLVEPDGEVDYARSTDKQIMTLVTFPQRDSPISWVSCPTETAHCILPCRHRSNLLPP